MLDSHRAVVDMGEGHSGWCGLNGEWVVGQTFCRCPGWTIFSDSVERRD